ncbi:MAG: SUF system NifU family Fe-S cluster assembly protein [Gammaproteobacteria bacterium]|jgi:nitrogen fixation NifU-like protein|nr:SUF system NifU family Fe-S cluster assembly protein [Gammaproteobacteria bacterium]
MALDKLYQQVILDHNRSPHHHGRLEGATHSARGQDALCGDDILVELRVADGTIREAAFSGEACAITTASASMLMDWLVGRGVGEIESQCADFERLLADAALPDDPDLGDINHLRAVSGFPARVRNALLPWRTALDALNP